MLNSGLLLVGVLIVAAIRIANLDAKGRSSARSHGYRLTIVGAVISSLTWLPNNGEADQALAQGIMVIVVGAGLISRRPENPQMAERLGKLAGTSWQMGLGFIVLASGLATAGAAVIARYGEELALPALLVAIAGVALAAHGSHRRKRVKRTLGLLPSSSRPTSF